MTAKTTSACIAVIAAMISLKPARVTAQGAPPPPTRVATSVPATPAAITAPAPLRVPASAPVPPPPTKVVTPASALPPSDSAVALCMNGTFVKLPGTPADCATRGGLRVTLARRIKTPPPAPGTPAAAAATAARSLSARTVNAAAAAPVGATARCKDATYVTTTPSPTVCDAHGGVAMIIPAAKPAPTSPPRRP